MQSADWARKGQHVLKVYADGRKYGKSSGDYAFRCELSARDHEDHDKGRHQDSSGGGARANSRRCIVARHANVCAVLGQ